MPGRGRAVMSIKSVLLTAAAILVVVGPMPTRAAESELDWLLAVYATRPQGYPDDKAHARPDTSVPFRWHFYHEGAVEPFADAGMLPHAEVYNPLEGEGVEADPKGRVAWKFVKEHATRGGQALRVDYPADAIKDGKAVVRVRGLTTEPGRYLSHRLKWLPNAFGPHFRWIKVDVFNPSMDEVRVRVHGVPMVLRPGANIVAVRTVDAVDRGYAGVFMAIPVEVTAPARDVTLFIDNVRLEQELPAVMSRRGRLCHFPGREDAKAAPVQWPGFTAVTADSLYAPERGFGWAGKAATRRNVGHSFRSCENGLLWGHAAGIDSPFRVDLPKGRYGVAILGAPGYGHPWSKVLTVKVNGKEHVLLPPRTDDELRRVALAGEAWDFRPGACLGGARPPAAFPADGGPLRRRGRRAAGVRDAQDALPARAADLPPRGRAASSAGRRRARIPARTRPR